MKNNKINKDKLNIRRNRHIGEIKIRKEREVKKKNKKL